MWDSQVLKFHRNPRNAPGGFLLRLPESLTAERSLQFLNAGDVEKNSGPGYPCAFYNKHVITRDYSIFCIDCLRWILRSCAGCAVKEIKEYANYRWQYGRMPAQQEREQLQKKKHPK